MTTGARLARWSWLSFLIFFAVNFLGRAGGILVPAELVGLLVMLIGFGLAIAALLRIPTDGRRGVLKPGLVGLVLNGAFIIVWVSNAVAVLNRTRGPG